jgi:multiple RNA-binding domain-containing protein 1
MNTRLIIKNVPKHIKDADFKAHFAKFGTITDAKIMRRPDGHSRQFGFIGRVYLCGR